MQKLAVLILTKNEEKNIEAVIRNAQSCANEIIVIDAGSTDKTVELAQGAGAKVCHREWDGDFSAQRNYALTTTDAEWLLYLDADERIDEKMLEAIKKLMRAGGQNAQYDMLRKTVAFGEEFRYGVLDPDKVTRLFPRNEVHWTGRVHERPVCNRPHIMLPGFLQHYTYQSWEQYLDKMNKYSSIAAVNYYENHKRAYFFKDIVARPLFAFIKMYFIKLGFLEGKYGYLLAVNYAIYTMNKYSKLIALYKRNEE